MNLRDKFLEVLHSKKPHINIGKKGVYAEGVLDHIQKTLKKEKIIKIHAHKTALIEKSVKEIADYVEKRTNSFLIDVRGHSFIISKYNIDRKGIQKRTTND